MKSVLVTGSNGLLGTQVVAALLKENYHVVGVSTGNSGKCHHERYQYIAADLTNWTEVEAIFTQHQFSHVIHLAGIAHVIKGTKISWSRYYRVNTMMSRKIFECANAAKVPIFFASTVDVYGITQKIITETTEVNPIGDYARSKYLAEKIIMESSEQPYLIARFAPIYTDDDLRDVHRRYYLSYPDYCYRIGKGMEYEFLSSRNAVNLIIKWVESTETLRGIVNVCDEKRHNTKDLIEIDRENGLAGTVVWIPGWLRGVMRFGVDIVFYKNPVLKFSAYKIIFPVRIDGSKYSEIVRSGNFVSKQYCVQKLGVLMDEKIKS